MQTLDSTKHYRAICFDLDGTILPMDIDEFMASYFKRLEDFMCDHGLEGTVFLAGLKAGIGAMAAHDLSQTNEEAFWECFYDVFSSHQDMPLDAIRSLTDEFYEHDFPRIGDGFVPNPAVSRTINALAAKGYPLILATMPMFPRRAVEHRLRWAGVDSAVFSRITNYSNSRSVKPKPTYFAEQLAAADLTGDDVLMVGNNTLEDFAFLDLGANGYLVTDCLLNPIDFDLDGIAHGSFGQLEELVAGFPKCTDPADNITDATISPDKIVQTLEENAIVAIDMEDMNAKAAAVADAASGDHTPGAAERLKL